MSQGRISQTHRRYPAARRYEARYPGGVRTRRVNGLPPQLLRGISRRKTEQNQRLAAAAMVGGVILLLLIVVSAIAFVTSAAAAVSGTVYAYRQVNNGLPNAALV